MNYREIIEREYYNTLVHKKWDNRSLYIVKKNPPFGLDFFDLFDTAKEYLGNFQGKKILDIGCGSGEISTWMAKNGAEVYAVDISNESIKIANKRALENNVLNSTHFNVCSAHNLPFSNKSFDIVFTNVSLHHLDVDIALKEINRVLKFDGFFVAIEPFAFSNILQKIRNSKIITKIYPIIQETPTERMLTKKDLETLDKYFSKIEYQPRQTIFYNLVYRKKLLISVLGKIFFLKKKKSQRRQKMNHKLKEFDKKLLKNFPLLKSTARFIIFKVTK